MDTRQLDPSPVFFFITRETINALWRVHDADKASVKGERVYFDRITGPISRKIRQAWLSYPSILYSEHHIEVTRRLLNDVEVTLAQEVGSSHGWISEVSQTWPGDDRTLSIKTSLGDSRLSYRTLDLGALRLEWSTPAEYTFNGSDADLAFFRGYFESRGHTLLYRLLPPMNPLAHDVSVHFENGGKFLPWLGLIGEDTRALSIALPAAERNHDENLIIVSSFMYPEVYKGLPPSDSQWFTSLLCPPSSLKFGDGVFEASLYSYWALYEADTEATSPSSDNEIAGLTNTMAITPLARVIGRFDGRQEIVLEPPGEVIFGFEGTHLGGMEREGGRQYYLPPAALENPVELEPANKTERPAALSATLREPVTSDVIKARRGEHVAYSTFISRFAPQTHFFKVKVTAGKLSLTLWYVSADSDEEVEVPAKEIEWHIVSGNGNMSWTGVFTPAPVSPTAFTAVWARDLGDTRFMYWAFTIIPVPLFSAEKVSELFNE